MADIAGPVADRLERVLGAGTWRELEPLLTAPADSEVGVAVRRWYRSRRAHWTKEHQWASGQDEAHDPRGCLRLLAVALAKPDQAASWVHKLSGSSGGPTADLLLDLAAGRGAEWCQAFADSLAQLKLGRDDTFGSGWIAELSLPLIVAGLVSRTPRGPAFAQSWAAYRSAPRIKISAATYAAKHPEHLRGRPGPALPTGTLVGDLRADPVVADALAQVMATPGCLGTFEWYSGNDDWELGPAVAQLAREGVLDRDRVLTDALASLTRQDAARTQRVTAKLITALEPTAADVADRLPLVLGLLATCRSSVTGALLPATLDAVGKDDLVDVAATIFARPEKAQKSVLLKAISAKDAVGRWGRESVVAALERATQVPDAAFAARAEKALAALGVDAVLTDAMPVAALWADPPVVGGAVPVAPIEPTEQAMTAAVSRTIAQGGVTNGALLWDALVRWCRRDLDAAGRWVVQTLEGLEPWQAPAALRAWWEPDAHWVDNPSARPVTELFRSEIAARLGDLPCLLSTPTRSDGTLDLDVLLQRLREHDGAAVGPVDLGQALLRLGPVSPDRAAELDGVSLPLWSPEAPRRWFGGRGVVGPDAAALVRTWVAGGGLPLVRGRHLGSQIEVDPVPIPVPPTTLGLPAALFAGHAAGQQAHVFGWAIDSETGLGVLPWWPDLLCAQCQGLFDSYSRNPPEWLLGLAHAASPGPAVQHVVAASLVHADEDRRLMAVEATLTLIGRGIWDSATYTECCRHLLADGKLFPGRLAHAWEQLVLAGALRPLWPTMEVVLQEATSIPRKPSGLAELLAMTARYAAAVPGAVVPPAVAALAAAKSASKTRAEARAFVTAVDGAGR